MSGEEEKRRRKKKKSSSSDSAQSSKRRKPTTQASIAKVTKKEFEQWEDSGEETAFLTLESTEDNVLTMSFGDSKFTLTVPTTYPKFEDGDHFFVFSEAANLSSWLMRMSDFCERRSTKTLTQFCTKAATVYLEEIDDDDDFDEEDDDNDAFGDLDDDMATDGDFSLQSADFKDSLELLAKKKRWAAKETEIRNRKLREKEQAEREAAMARRAGGLKLSETQKKVDTIFSASGSSAVLTNDLLKIMAESNELGFSAEPIEDDIYNWRVKMFNFSPESRLARDLMELKEKHEYDFIELEVAFAMDLYPFFPPFVKLIRPRFHGFMMGAVASSPLFKLSHWDPVAQASAVLTKLRSSLQKEGAIDVGATANDREKYPDGAYTPIEHALLRLQLLSEVASRSSAQIGGDASKVVTSAPKPTTTTSDVSNSTTSAATPQAWAKGTGYGFSGAGKAWDVDAYLAAQAAKDAETQAVLVELEQLTLKAAKEVTTAELQGSYFSTIEGSCLVPFLEIQVANESLLDMSRHYTLYCKIFSLLSALVNCAWLRPLLARLLNQRKSLVKELEARRKQCALFLKTVDGGTSTGQTESDDTRLARAVVSLWSEIEPHLDELAQLTRDTEALEAKLAAKLNKKNVSVTATKQDERNALEAKYKEALEELQFDEDEMSTSGGYTTHHYSSTIAAERNITRQKTLRAAQEQSSLSTSLPMSWSSSVFVRVDSSRVDVLRALITGPEDTPYENGCFQFDIFLPAAYPDAPPLVNLQTTGAGQVRFNPNLYNCGKVCLSLLGTWSGEAGENWNRDTSTLLQVFVSIQSLILVEQPYFNEPSYERSMNTPQGQQQSEAYNDNIRLQCMRHAILGQLKNPSQGFEDVIKTHFRLKKQEIEEQCDKWIEMATTRGKPQMETICKSVKSELAKL